MKKTTLNFTKIGVLAVFALFSMTFVSCGDDEVTGCTDEAAENYDAEATVSGDCTYAADKFIGDYVGSSDCSGGPIIMGLSNDTLMFSVTESVGGGPNDVLISIPIQGTPVAFASSVSGDDLTVDAVLEGLPFPNPFDPTTTINVDVSATGVMVYDATDDSATGDITITIMSSDSGATLDTGACTITGIKQ